jgi:hypothetical protein
MDFKLVNKKNIGAVSVLLLIIILNQSNFLNFLIDTSLGRAVLIAFIIFISSCNKIMGIVGVLLIMIMFNNSRTGILEGFDTEAIKPKLQHKNDTDIDACGNNTTPSLTPSPSPSTSETSSPSTSETSSPSTSETPSLTPSTPTTPITTTPNVASLQSKTEQAKEGFDIIGTENNIKRGKQSNSISVNNNSRNSENVEPYESNVFSSSNYSQF